jgi:hypothetical protein
VLAKNPKKEKRGAEVLNLIFFEFEDLGGKLRVIPYLFLAFWIV